MNKSYKKIQKLSSVSALFLISGFSLINTEKSSALEVKFLPEDYGYYSESGFHFEIVENYVVGSCGGNVPSTTIPFCPDSLGNELRNFFIFDTEALSGNTNMVNQATLSLQNPQIQITNSNPFYSVGTILKGFNSVDGFEDYRLKRITDDPSGLDLLSNDYLPGSTEGADIFNDLGLGALYNEPITQITDSDNGSFVNIPLNDNAINDIFATDSKFGAGGSIETLDLDPDQLESAFAFTDEEFGLIGTGAIGDEPVSIILDAGEISLNASERGFYTSNGFYFGSDSYFAGDCRGDLGQCRFPEDLTFDPGEEIRNFFVFDFQSISEINGNFDAFLRLEIPNTFTLSNDDPSQGFASTGDDSENYILANVLTPIDDLLTPDFDGGLPGTDIFKDLGTGVFYSEEFEIDENDLGGIIEIPLNTNAVQDIVSSIGGRFALSGAITTLNNNVDIADDEFAFAGTNAAFGITDADSAQLVLRDSINGVSLFSTNLSSPLVASSIAAENVSSESTKVFDINAIGLTTSMIEELNQDFSNNSNSASTPEPSSLVALLGLGALGFVGKNKKKNSV